MYDFTLPQWFARLFGPEVQPGEGATCFLRLTCPCSGIVMLLCCTAALLIVWAIYLRENPALGLGRRATLATMRSLQILIVAAMLCAPVLIVQRTGLPDLLLLLDDSQSMAIMQQARSTAPTIASKGDQLMPNRWHQIQRLLTGMSGASESSGSPTNDPFAALTSRPKAQLDELSHHYRVVPYYLSAPQRPLSGTPDDLRRQILEHSTAHDSSRLGEAIRQMLDSRQAAPPAAIVLLSDGNTTAGPTPADVAASVARDGTALYTIGLGDESVRPQIVFTDMQIDPVLLVDDLAPLDVMVIGTDVAQMPIRVELWQESIGDDPSKQLVAEDLLRFDQPEQARPLRLIFKPDQEGLFRYTLHAVPTDPSIELQYNSPGRDVEVVRHRIRVLLVQSSPSFEYRFLRDLLNREPTTDLQTWLQDADPEHAAQDEAQLREFPTPADLREYDVVVLGDADPQRFTRSQLQDLADYVTDRRSRASLICLAGPNFMPHRYADTPLAELLPFDPRTVQTPPASEPLQDGFQVIPTSLGLQFPGMQLTEIETGKPLPESLPTGDETRASPTDTENMRLWRQLPMVYRVLHAGQLKPGVRVLADARSERYEPDGQSQPENRPAITLHYIGAGKVMFHNMATWRWRRGPYYPYYARYWVQTIRHLAGPRLAAGDRAVQLTTDRTEYPVGQPVMIRLRILDVDRVPQDTEQGVRVQLENLDSGEVQIIELQASELQPDSFETQLPDLAAGNYRVRLATLIGLNHDGGAAEDGDNARDLALQNEAVQTATFRILQTSAELQHIGLNESALRDAARLGEGAYADLDGAALLFRNLPRGRHTPIEMLPPVPVWNRWPWLFVLLLLITIEWWQRKRWRLV